MQTADFPMVFIDEAGQCDEPSSLVPLMKGSRHLVLIGDHKQLPSVVSNPVSQIEGLNISLFERLMRQDRECSEIPHRSGAGQRVLTRLAPCRTCQAFHPSCLICNTVCCQASRHSPTDLSTMATSGTRKNGQLHRKARQRAPSSSSTTKAQRNDRATASSTFQKPKSSSKSSTNSSQKTDRILRLSVSSLRMRHRLHASRSACGRLLERLPTW